MMTWLSLILLNSAVHALASPGTLDELLASMTYADYRAHVAILSGEQDFQGHFIADRFSRGGLCLARTYIKSVLARTGFRIQKEVFPITNRRGGKKRYSHGVNYYVDIPGRGHPEEIILMGAHYDTQGLRVRGANDNASGVGALLLALEAMARLEIRSERTLRFAFYDVEEIHFQGSLHHFHRSALYGEDIRLQVNLDMVAYPMSKHSSFFYDARQYQDGVVGLIREAMAALPKGSHMEALPAPRVYKSDHQTGALVGVPSIGIAEHVRTEAGATLRISPNYHTARDRLLQLDLAYALRVAHFATALALTAGNSAASWNLPEDAARRAAACEHALEFF